VLNKAYKTIKKFWPVGLAALFLLFAGILAITQEADEDSALDEFPLDDMLAGFSGYDDEDAEGEQMTVWEPPGPPRWFRSNAGGMTLEEIPSRLTALHHKYALVIDYVPPHELEMRLLPYYRSGYMVEIRILYENGAEVRRQWLFRDESGATRLNAVFVPLSEEPPDETEIMPEEIAEKEEFEETEFVSITLTDNDIDNIYDIEEIDNIDDIDDIDEIAEIDELDETPPPPAPINRDTAISMGFIEIFNEEARIIEERQFFDNDSETLIIYSYNTNILVKAEAQERRLDEEFRTAYVDYYRYNRSYSLRHVERRFYDASYRQPVRLTFPGRVLDAAFDENFISDKLTISSDFMGAFSAAEGYRVIYHTDNRGRILTQTMIDNKDEEVWVIVNTWSGDRIVAMRKVEGEDEKVTEYEYDSEGDRVVQRDIHNGVLERLVRTDGANETEELYLDGNLVLKAYWVDGRKVSEERVRRR